MGSVEVPNGVSGDDASYSVTQQAQRVFREGILQNPHLTKDLPPEIKDTASKIQFTGTDKPSIPINWRFAESAAALKALEASLIGVLLKRKYGVDVGAIEIDADHAQLFSMSTVLWTLDPKGDAIKLSDPPAKRALLDRYIPNCDKHRIASSFHRSAATNIYKTKDGKWFHLHGSMNPDPTLDSIGLPHDMPAPTYDDALPPFRSALSQLTSTEMQHRATDRFKQAGTICNSVAEYFASEHGKANAHIDLFEIHGVPSPTTQPPTWWPSTPHTRAARPLAGLKVVDLTRVIAAPAVTRGLAELGASVMRLTSPNITDFSSLHIDLNWGKWNAHCDLKTFEGRAALKDLVLDADVVVQGYRPGVLDKYGFGVEDVIKICEKRERGIISVRENCYGWYGPWKDRSGWQQISDASVGISEAFGRAMGLKDHEAVTPVFPNSDYMTGVAGVCAVLVAVMRRGVEGGSYKVDLALNYYNQWLARSVGEYPKGVWEEVWGRNGKVVFRAEHNMGYTIPRMMGMMVVNSGKTAFQEDFFEERWSGALGTQVRTLKPVLRFVGGEVELGYNVGTRGNGVDVPRWPEDLMVEVVR